MKNEKENPLCPCTSGNPYSTCCKPFHQGSLPKTALQLMRSRYSAYALGLSDYIIHTTHPNNPQRNPDLKQWSKQIMEFCSNTEFTKLDILDFQEKELFATVTFRAHLTQNANDASFTEQSYFEKIKGKWLYLNGERHQ